MPDAACATAPVRACPFCSANLEVSAAVCPSCGKALVERRRNRVTPVANEIMKVPANEGSLMSEYTILQAEMDGSLICNCPSFEEQNKSLDHLPFGNCTHIRNMPRDFLNAAVERFKRWVRSNDGTMIPPSRNQRAQLHQFKTRIHDRLSYAQAYFIVNNALKRQGIQHWEYIKVMEKRGEASILPKLVFGIELECYASKNRGSWGAVLGEIGDKLNFAQARREDFLKIWKLTNDGSLTSHMREQDLDPREIVSPPLYGAYGFEQILTLTSALNKFGVTADKSCGFHVHVNAKNESDSNLTRLLKTWHTIQTRFIYGLVSPSRRNGDYCENVTLADIRKCESHGARSFDDGWHHRSLSFSPLTNKGSIEFRSAPGTTQLPRVKNWVIFILKLTDAVFSGLGPDDVKNLRTIEDLLDAIGMDMERSTSQIITSRNWCIQRFYEQFKWHESDIYRESLAEISSPHPVLHIEEPEEPEVPDGEIHQDGAETRSELYARVLRDIERKLRELHPRPILPTFSQRAVNSVESLCHCDARDIHISDLFPLLTSNTCNVRSSSGSGEDTYTITYDVDQDTLTCVCQGFRTRKSCRHSIMAARFIYLVRLHYRELFHQNHGYIMNLDTNALLADAYNAYTRIPERRRLTVSQMGFPSVRTLSALPVRGKLDREMLESGLETGKWNVLGPVRRSNRQRRYSVMLKSIDELVCSCGRFETGQKCSHSIQVARYLSALWDLIQSKVSVGLLTGIFSVPGLDGWQPAAGVHPNRAIHFYKYLCDSENERPSETLRSGMVIGLAPLAVEYKMPIGILFAGLATRCWNFSAMPLGDAAVRSHVVTWSSAAETLGCSCVDVACQAQIHVAKFISAWRMAIEEREKSTCAV